MKQRRQAPRTDRIEGMAPEILDVAGAARLLGVSTRTIYKLANDKVIPAAKVGKEWRFSRKRLIEWIANGAEPTAPMTLDELLRSSNVRVAPRG
jgi:excisionase family DNA binding protein